MRTPSEKIRECLRGIDKDQMSGPDGWWETSTGVEFGTKKLAEVLSIVGELESNAEDEAVLGDHNLIPSHKAQIEELVEALGAALPLIKAHEKAASRLKIHTTGGRREGRTLTANNLTNATSLRVKAEQAIKNVR